MEDARRKPTRIETIALSSIPIPGCTVYSRPELYWNDKGVAVRKPLDVEYVDGNVRLK